MMRGYFRRAKFVPFARWVVLCLLALAAVPGARAQNAVLDIAGRQLAGAISNTKQDSVAVMDFSGPGRRVSALGQKLADTVSAAMAKAGGQLRVKDRSQIQDIRRENSYAPGIILDPESLVMFAKTLKVKTVVTGAMSLDDKGSLAVELSAYRLDNGKGILTLTASMPLTPEMTLLMAKSASVQLDTLVSFSVDAAKLKAGYKLPHCIYCPYPGYTGRALDQHIQGIVVLTAIIGIDGRATDISVVNGLPGGLTAKSIATLKTWRLRPATTPDGRRMPFFQLIEMQFILFGKPVRF